MDDEGEAYDCNIVGCYSSAKRGKEGKNMNEQKKGSLKQENEERGKARKNETYKKNTGPQFGRRVSHPVRHYQSIYH